MARPSKLTPEVTAKVAQFLRGGASRGDAAGLVGVHVSTLERWMSQGADESAEPEYREFRERVIEAELTCKMEMTLTITNAARKGDPKAALTFLERRYGAEWGRKDHLTTETTIGAKPVGVQLPLQLLGEILNDFPEAKAAVGAVLEKRLAEAKRLQIEDKGEG